MRETRIAQASLFDSCSKHGLGVRFKPLSDVLDEHPEILKAIHGERTAAPNISSIGSSRIETDWHCFSGRQAWRKYHTPNNAMDS